MLGGFFGSEQELKPLSRQSSKNDSPALAETVKSVTDSYGRPSQLHLFQYQGPQIVKDEGEVFMREEPDHILHEITSDDTLDGIALQYGVSKTSIKVLNDLATDDIFFLKKLNIPQHQIQNFPQSLNSKPIEQSRFGKVLG